MPLRRIAPAACVMFLLAGCGREDVAARVAVTDPARSSMQAVPGHGTGVTHDQPPIGAFDVYVDGFHFVSGDMAMQFEAHQYCAALNEDVEQCVLFDGNGRDAKLVGVEYVVSRRVFEQMNSDERRLWHSHAYEVKSGYLAAPGVDDAAEHGLMRQRVGTYGKTWRTWHSSRGTSLPLGHPVLMAGFTADGQIEPKLLAARDERLKLASSHRRRSRQDIPAPLVAGGADAWQLGEAWQLVLRPVTATPAADDRAGAERDDAVIVPLRRNRTSRSAEVYAGLEAVARE